MSPLSKRAEVVHQMWQQVALLPVGTVMETSEGLFCPNSEAKSGSLPCSLFTNWSFLDRRLYFWKAEISISGNRQHTEADKP